MSDYDSPWKEALDLYFESFLLFFFPQAHADIDWTRPYETLDKELQKIVPAAEQGRRIVDRLVKVWLKSGEESWLLIHVEVQTWRETDFAHRMHMYNHRIFDRYNRETISFAVLADDDPDWRPTHYGYARWGFRTGTEFPIAKLLDYAANWQVLEADTNPFAILVLAHLKAMETRRDPADRQVWKVRLLRSLYERGFDAERVRQLLRFIDWMMVLPPLLNQAFEDELHRYEEEKRMPYIPTYERRARTEELLAAIEMLLEIKFGPEGLQLLPEIKQITDVGMLQNVRAAFKGATTMEELQRIWKP